MQVALDDLIEKLRKSACPSAAGGGPGEDSSRGSVHSRRPRWPKAPSVSLKRSRSTVELDDRPATRLAPGHR